MSGQPPSLSGAMAGPEPAVGQKPWQRLSLLLLILIALGLRTYRLDARGFWWDESLTVYRAQQSLGGVLSGRIDFPGASTVDQHPPLYFVLLHVVTRLTGPSDWSLLFPSVAFSVLLVPLLYVLGTRLRNRNAGLLAAGLGALSPYYLWYAQEARMYTMLAALGLGATYCLWRGLGDRRRVRWIAAFGLLTLMAMTTQYLYALMLAVSVLIALPLWSHGPDAPRSTTRWSHRRLLLVLGGPALVLPIVAWQVWRHIPMLGANRFYVPLDIMLVDALNSFSLGLSVRLDQVWALNVLFAALYGLGVAVAWRPSLGTADSRSDAPARVRGAAVVTLVGHILVPLVGMWLFSLLFAPLYMGSRYVFMSSPAFYLGVAFGLDLLARRWRVVAALVTATIVVGIGASTYRYLTHDDYRVKEDYRAAAWLIREAECVGDAIVVTGVESVPAFAHYYTGNLPVVGVPTVGSNDEQVEEELLEILATYQHVWLVEGNREISDPWLRVPRVIDARRLLLRRNVFLGWVHPITVSRYGPRPGEDVSHDATTQPLGVFGSRLALLDYALVYYAVDGTPQQIGHIEWQEARAAGLLVTHEPIPSGHTIALQLRTRPLQALADYKTSLRLVDARGIVVAQRDDVPFEYYPTSQWPTDAAIQHQATLSIPAGLLPSEYTLQLLFYDAQTAHPLPFTHASNDQEPEGAIDLGLVRIGPWARNAPTASVVPPHDRRMPVPTVFGRTLELLGHGTPPSSIGTGSPFDLALYWRMRAGTNDDHLLTIEWVDARGRVGYSELLSVGGNVHPTSRWVRGDVVREVLKLIVPDELAPGRYTIRLWVARADGSAPLGIRRGPLPWSGRRLSIGTIIVE